MWMISMKAVLDIVSQYCPDDDGSCSKAGVDLREMLDEIEGLDETEAEPVKHGRWLDNPIHSQLYSYICSNCRNSCDWTYRYCPNCGSKNRMDGDKDNNVRNLTDEETAIYESWIQSEAKDTALNIMDGDSDG